MASREKKFQTEKTTKKDTSKQNLAATHPQLAKEADGWDAKSFATGSHQKMPWKCSKGHKWEARIAHRSRGSGCPICSGRVVKKGFNDLRTTHPLLAKEADGWDAKLYSAGSNKKMSWKCSRQHKWEASIAKRASGKGCPYCANRQILIGFNDLRTTHPEIAKQAYKWDTTKVTAGSGKKFDWKCSKGHVWAATVLSRKQGKGCSICSGHSVMPGANDLMTTHPKIASEAVGWDATKYSAGSNQEMTWKCSKGHEYRVVIYNRTLGVNCPVCSNRQYLKGQNDLKTLFPALASEALGWDTSAYMSNSHEIKKWRCNKGHVWEDAIIDRADGSGCHVCSGRKVLSGVNDLQTMEPDIAREAVGWDTSKFTVSSNAIKLWRCHLGHTWKSTISNRTKGLGCPYCGGKQVLPGFNDLKTTHPRLALEALEWDTTKYSRGSNKKVRWLCEYGHEWDAVIVNRVNGRGCPSCAKTSFDPNALGILYLLFHPVWMVYKIGISNSSINRTELHKSHGWEVLEMNGPMDGLLAYGWEQSILKMLKNRGADLGREDIAGKFDGYTESWVADSFPITSIKELMDYVYEDEDNSSS
jgi:Probable Zinc-ribbon domain